jgi:methanogenic corrinoid protein MtbC1
VRPTNTPTATPRPTNTLLPAILGSRVVIPTTIRARTNFNVSIMLDNPASAAGGGVDAMEIQCTVSPTSRLIGQSYSNGTVFGPNPVIVAQATSSSIVYAVSQSGTNPPVRVGGTVLTLTIRAASAGQGTITCAVEVIGGNGVTTMLNIAPVTFTVR